MSIIFEFHFIYLWGGGTPFFELNYSDGFWVDLVWNRKYVALTAFFVGYSMYIFARFYLGGGGD